MSKQKADLSDGYTRIANSILEALYTLPILSRESRVLLFILRQTYGFKHKERELSNGYIAKGTGIDAKHISKIIQGLISSKILKRVEARGRQPQVLAINTNISEWIDTTPKNGDSTTPKSSVPKNGDSTIPIFGDNTTPKNGDKENIDINIDIKKECGGNKFPPTHHPVFESLWDEWQWSKIGKDKVPRRCRDEVEKIGYKRMTDARYRYQEYFAELSTQNNQPLSARTWFTEGYKQFLPKTDNNGFWTAIGGECYKHKNGKDVLVE